MKKAVATVHGKSPEAKNGMSEPSAGKTGREIRQVEVLIKSQRRTMTFEVFAKKDPVRAAKRFAKDMGFGAVDFDWPNAIVKIGPIPESGGPELEPFEQEIFRQLLAGELTTEVVV
jgi:hypothetical protein